MAHKQILDLAQQSRGQLQVFELLVLPVSRPQLVVQAGQVFDHHMQPPCQLLDVGRVLQRAHRTSSRQLKLLTS